jgi:hypothetical protein
VDDLNDFIAHGTPLVDDADQATSTWRSGMSLVG